MGRLARFAGGALEAGWLATVVLVPLFINAHGTQAFDPAKAGVLRALAVSMLVAWAIRSALTPRAAGDEAALPASVWARAVRVPLVLPAALVLASASLATALSISPHESFWGHRERAGGTFTLLAELAVFAATLANLGTRRQLERLLSALLLPSLPIAAYAVFQRFDLEPLRVVARETDIQRATSLLGQPVFLGAYLGMVVPFTCLRLAQAFDVHAGARGRATRIGLYAGLLLLQLSAALFSESRGPLLGMAAGGALAFLSVAARRGWRRSVLGMAALTVCAAVLLALKPPAPAAEPASQHEADRIARRAAAAFEVRGSGGLYRTVNWAVAERVLRNRAPIELADGSRDPRAGLRVLTGYGPELQYGISSPFYDPELPRSFGYFVADRYHNELWDTVITTGALGLGASLLLQAALFYALLRWLQFLSAPRHTRLFWVAYGGGAMLGAAASTALQGIPYLFLGLQIGSIAGLALFLIAVTFARERPEGQLPQEGLLLATLAAVVAHLIEISFSFTVIATGTLFWVACAVAVLAGHFQRGAEPAPAPAPASAAGRASPGAGPWREASADAALLALATMALGFAFIGRTASGRTGALLWESLTALSEPAGARVPVVAALVLVTLAAGALLFALERGETFALGASVARALTLAAPIAGCFWIWLAAVLAGRANAPSSAGFVAWRLAISEQATSGFYAAALLVVLLLAWATAPPLWQLPSRRPLAPSGWRLIAAPLCALLGGWVIALGSLRPAFADAAAALGEALKAQNRMALAEDALERAIAAARPDADTYRAMLAKAYTKHARVDTVRGDAWFERAERALREVIARNPIATENASNLALMRGSRALQESGPKREQLRAGVVDAYARALRLHPMDPLLWSRWGSVQLELLHDATAALHSARRALELEPKGAAAYALIADCQAALAEAQTGAPRRAAFFEAAAAYTKANALAPRQPAVRVKEGRAYVEAGQPAKAIAAFQRALAELPARSPARGAIQDMLKQAETANALVAAPKQE